MLQISLITLSGAANISERITCGLLLTSNRLINKLRRRFAEFLGTITFLELVNLKFKIFEVDIEVNNSIALYTG